MAKPKVLLTFIESGMGHIMSMRAIEDSLKDCYGDSLDIISSNIMKEDSYPSLEWMERFLVKQTINTNKSRIYSKTVFFIMTCLGKEKFMRVTNKTIFKKATKALVDSIVKINPDAIICNHYYITACAIVARDKYLPNMKVITYNPDNNVHVWWDPQGDLFINNNVLAMQEAILKRGFEKSKLRQVGFVIRDEVRKAKGTKEEYRKKYGLDDKFTIIISDGAYASGKAYPVLKQLLKSDRNINIIFIAGKNEKLLKKLSSPKFKVPKNIRLIPLGFQEHIYELYKASDLFITKAGPNAVLDCIYMGTPVLIDLYAHPIEKATTKLFIDLFNYGEECYHMKNINSTINRLMDNPSVMQQYRDNIASFNREQNGAKEVADIIYHEVGEKSHE